MELPMFYDQVEEWNRALLLYEAALKEVNTKLEILNSEFQLAHQYNPIEHITSRIKSPQSIAKKMRHNEKELTVENIVKYINDVAGIRVICSFTSDIYRLADLIRKQNDVKVLKVKDYIMNPKENGYTSYHMIVSIPIFLSEKVVETKVEIQIRTIAMDFWASLEHKMYYKFEGNAPEHIRRELKECADIVAFLDKKMLALNEEIKTYSVDPMNSYRELISDMFQDKIKDAYGTIVEEDTNVIEMEVEKKDDAEISQEMKPFVFDESGDDMLSALQEKIISESNDIMLKKENDEIMPQATTTGSDKVHFSGSIFGRDKRKKQDMKATAN